MTSSDLYRFGRPRSAVRRGVLKRRLRNGPGDLRSAFRRGQRPAPNIFVAASKEPWEIDEIGDFVMTTAVCGGSRSATRSVGLGRLEKHGGGFFAYFVPFTRKPVSERCLVWLRCRAIHVKMRGTNTPVNLHAIPGLSVRAERSPVQQMPNGPHSGDAIRSCLSDFLGGNERAGFYGWGLARAETRLISQPPIDISP